MVNDQFERIMRFAQRTGDRLIVTDPSGNEPVVIMGLDEYEALVEGAMGPDGKYPMMGDIDMDDEEEDFVSEYGEAPTLEIIEEPVMESPVQPIIDIPTEPEKTVPIMQNKAPEKQAEINEEQFYLEPLG